ncbi:MAG: ABC transporter permease, partial [Acidobacteriota bacterium]|nr:ABC transporter permease [Acidobacteriota bacterium]
DVALYFDTSGNLTDGDSPERIGLSRATVNVFEVLGVTPVLGRTFTRDEAKAETPDVVVLSHELWTRRYGGAHGIVGDRIELDGVPRTVLGILPAGFRLPIDFASELPFDVYVPMDVPDGTAELPENGGSHSYYVVARLAEGVSAEAAQVEALAWNQRAVADGHYDQLRQFATVVLPVADDVVGNARTAIWILVAAVGFVLMIACVNVANLMLSRGQERRREIALRTALGAGWQRIFGQLMTESLVLAVLGGVVALVLAHWSLAALLTLEPGSVPRLQDARLDGIALLFALAITIVTAAMFGALPALSASRPRLRDALTRGGRGMSGGVGSQRFRGGLVAFQLAVAVVLVMAAGLMIRTFAHLIAIDPGFRADNVLTMRLSIPDKTYPDDADVIGF